MIDFDLAMVVVTEHRRLTGHDCWEMLTWNNNCDTCMWLMNVCKSVKEQEEKDLQK